MTGVVGGFGVAVDLLNWLADHETPLADTGQADIDSYLAGPPPSRYRVRDLFDRDYGMTEFHVEDPNGCLVFVGQPTRERNQSRVP